MHVYLLDAEKLAPVADRCLPLLTPSRRSAAEQYRNQPAKLRTVAAGLLLYGVLGIREDAQLVFNEYGKPSLAAGGPQFSLSHAGRYAALALARFPLGVDIEPLGSGYPPILRRYLLPAELAWMDQALDRERFYLLWTRLESALKARGTGFACNERTFSLLGNSPLYFANTVYDGHMLACAAKERFRLQTSVLTVDDLLSPCIRSARGAASTCFFNPRPRGGETG